MPRRLPEALPAPETSPAPKRGGRKIVIGHEAPGARWTPQTRTMVAFPWSVPSTNTW